MLILNQMETRESTTDKLIDIDNYKLYMVRNPEEKYLKNNKMEKVYRKLKNDLKWYKKSASSVAFKQAEIRGKKESGIKETVDKKFAENTASRLVEEWWLGI